MRLLFAIVALYLLAASPLAVVVTSESMYPTLKKGDLVFLSHRPPAVGDVVVYEHNGIYIIHRIIAIDGNRVITKGDNPRTNDEPDPREVRRDDIVGVAALRVPYAGYAVLAFREYPILFVPLVLAALFYDRIFPEVSVDRKRLAAALIVALALAMLRMHPRTPEKAYLVDREAYFVGDGYYVSVDFFASGNVDAIIRVVTMSGSAEFKRVHVTPGTSGVRNVGIYVDSKPLEVYVWAA